MPITSIGHVAMRCRDVEETIAFYDKLEIPLAFRMSRADGTPGGPIFLKVAPGSLIELFAGGTEDPPESRATRGLVHICFHVDDIHAYHAAITTRGVGTNAAPAQGRSGNWSFTLRDPNGIGLEVVQLVSGTQMAAAAQ